MLHSTCRKKYNLPWATAGLTILATPTTETGFLVTGCFVVVVWTVGDGFIVTAVEVVVGATVVCFVVVVMDTVGWGFVGIAGATAKNYFQKKS